MATRQTTFRQYPYPVAAETPDVARDVKALAVALDNDINALLPIGTIIAFAGGWTPSGWLLCNGQTFSATVYPNLATLLGGNHTPNLVDRFIKGGTTVGTVGGSKTITTDQMPSHNHGGKTGGMDDNVTHAHLGNTESAGSHQHGTYASTRAVYQSGGGTTAVYHPGAPGDINTLAGGAHTHPFGTSTANLEHKHTIPSGGGGQDFEPKFYTVRYLIKAA